jgi:hypothetical protein
MNQLFTISILEPSIMVFILPLFMVLSFGQLWVGLAWRHYYGIRMLYCSEHACG